MINLSTKIAGVKFKNPLILASGIMGVTGASLVKMAAGGAGGVTAKSCSPEPRYGHPNPMLISYEAGLINCVGLSNPGVEATTKEVAWAKKNTKAVVLGSIFGGTVKDFVRGAKKMSEAKPDLIEINISCPNINSKCNKTFAADPKMAAQVVKAVKKNTKIPVSAKLSPNVENIKIIAKAVEEAGADAITAINALGRGLVIDIKTAKPVLSNLAGGISGSGIRPLAVNLVYEIYETVKIPIIGTGGVSTGRDVIEMIMAGASAVGIGSAVYTRGLDVFKKIMEEMKQLMEEGGYDSIQKMKGLAHK